MAEENRGTRLLILGQAKRQISCILKREQIGLDRSRARFQQVGSISTGASKAAYKKAKISWSAACESVGRWQRVLEELERWESEIREVGA